MRHAGFTLIEVLVSLSLLALVIMGSFAVQREYQVLAIQAHHSQEQQEQFRQLREIAETYSPRARRNACPACAIISAINPWRKALPSYMHDTLTLSGNNQLNIKLCSAAPTQCIDEKIVV
jgi:prepilin-type N-terminal cleavage/methylation domain-containing protein